MSGGRLESLIEQPDDLAQGAWFQPEGALDEPRLAARVAPIRWGHIALTGDYLWSELECPRERFRPLRTRRFDPDRFAGP